MGLVAAAGQTRGRDKATETEPASQASLPLRGFLLPRWSCMSGKEERPEDILLSYVKVSYKQVPTTVRGRTGKLVLLLRDISFPPLLLAPPLV